MAMNRLLWLALPALAACAGADPAQEAGHMPVVATSSNGTFVIEARTADGLPPARGLDSFDFYIVRAAGGDPATDLELRVIPWMPAMGHGAPEPKRVEPREPGHYRVEDVALYMPGTWELRTSIGPVDEHATLALDVR